LTATALDASACVNSLLKAAAPSTATRRALRQSSAKPTWTTTQPLVVNLRADWELQMEDGTPAPLSAVVRKGSVADVLTAQTAQKLEVPPNMADVSVEARQKQGLGQVEGWCWGVESTMSVGKLLSQGRGGGRGCVYRCCSPYQGLRVQQQWVACMLCARCMYQQWLCMASAPLLSTYPSPVSTTHTQVLWFRALNTAEHT
jgi:hypothetical protein